MAAAGAAHAQSQPRWEIGAGLAALSLPDYRGSDEVRGYLLPLPYLVYRGDLLQADRSGVSTRLFDSDALHLSLGLNATVPVHSADNRARRGMADLKPTLEFGPMLDIALWHSVDRKARLDARLPLRAAYTLQSPPRHVGWLFSPGLNLRLRDPAGMAGWQLGLLAGPQFASRAYNSYVYSIGAADAVAGRPAYQAGGGYAGSQVQLTLSKRYARWWVGGFMRYDALAGATFADSPLVRQRSSVAAGIGISWIFAESKERVPSSKLDDLDL